MFANCAEQEVRMRGGATHSQWLPSILENRGQEVGHRYSSSRSLIRRRNGIYLNYEMYFKVKQLIQANCVLGAEVNVLHTSSAWQPC